MKRKSEIRILLFTGHPVVAVGLTSAVNTARGLLLTGCCNDFHQAEECVRSAKPDIVLVHLTSGISLSDISRLRAIGIQSQIMLWSEEIGEEFAFQAMQLGVRAILASNSSIEALLTAIQNVHRGILCFEKDLLDRVLFRKRVALTRREGQIVALVSQGLKNKAIGETLGITEGTVKVYLYKLFRKLGVNDRLDMALYGLKHLSPGQFTPECAADKAVGEAHPPAAAIPYGPCTLPPRSEKTVSDKVLEWRQVM